jgi:hypothetical protein
VAPVGGGGIVADVGGGEAAVGDAVVVVVDVHEPATNATETIRRMRRARIARTLHLRTAWGAKGNAAS